MPNFHAAFEVSAITPWRSTTITASPLSDQVCSSWVSSTLTASTPITPCDPCTGWAKKKPGTRVVAPTAKKRPARPARASRK